MLNDMETRSRKSTRLSKIESCWRAKTALEQILVAVLLALTLALITLITLLVIIETGNSKICTTRQCVLSSAQIFAHVDFDANPCDDFYQFACGSFLKSLHGSQELADLSLLSVMIRDELNEILQEPATPDDNEWLKRQKEMLAKCIDQTNAEKEALQHLTEMLEDLGGWPVLSKSYWDEKLINWMQIVRSLNRCGYFADSLLHINVVDDYKRLDRNLVNIKAPVFTRIRQHQKEAYLKYMTGVAVAFGSGRDRANEEMNQVLIFMSNLTNIWKEGKSDNLTHYKVEDYQKLSGGINWTNYINELLDPVAKITKDDYAKFPCPEFVTHFLKLLENTPRKVLANYIMWSVVESAVKFLPKQIRKLQDAYLCSLNSKLNRESRLDFCITQVQQHMPVSPHHVEFTRRNVPAKKKEMIKQMIDNIKLEMINLIRANSWMDNQSKESSINKIETLREIIGAPRNYFDDSIFCQFENANETLTKNATFFEMFLSNHKQSRYLNYFKIHMDTDDTRIDEFFESVVTIDGMYLPVINLMFFPAGLLKDFFFVPDRPMYLNYALLGAIIGHELTHALQDYRHLFDETIRKNVSLIYTKETETIFKEKVQCLVEQAERFKSTHKNSKINGTLTLQENLADLTGFRLAYGAYSNWAKVNGFEKTLPGLSFTSTQLFWIISSFYECVGQKSSQHPETEPHAPSWYRAVAPLKNNFNFAKDFDCSVESDMNPRQKCRVY